MIDIIAINVFLEKCMLMCAVFIIVTWINIALIIPITNNTNFRLGGRTLFDYMVRFLIVVVYGIFLIQSYKCIF